MRRNTYFWILLVIVVFIVLSVSKKISLSSPTPTPKKCLDVPTTAFNPQTNSCKSYSSSCQVPSQEQIVVALDKCSASWSQIDWNSQWKTYTNSEKAYSVSLPQGIIFTDGGIYEDNITVKGKNQVEDGNLFDGFSIHISPLLLEGKTIKQAAEDFREELWNYSLDKTNQRPNPYSQAIAANFHGKAGFKFSNTSEVFIYWFVPRDTESYMRIITFVGDSGKVGYLGKMNQILSTILF